MIHQLAKTIAKSLPRPIHGKILKFYRNNPEICLASDYLCIKQDYSSPVTVGRDLDLSLLGEKRELPGVSIDIDRVLEHARSMAAYSTEFPWKQGGQANVDWNIMFPTLDSIALYCMIRHHKPKRYIEVGCGYSSRVSSAAAEANTKDGHQAKYTYIEPYPGERLEGFTLAGELIGDVIQDVPLDVFRELEAGDILFIDTSHIMKCQSDVEWELLHILPILKPGVIIHVHDIFTPYEQPMSWLQNNYAPGFYNEQYAFEAMLSGGRIFETLFPAHLMYREHLDFLKNHFSLIPDPGRSYWIVTSNLAD